MLSVVIHSSMLSVVIPSTIILSIVIHSVIMLNVVLQNVIILSIVIQSVMLSVVNHSVIILSAVIHGVIILSVEAPTKLRVSSCPYMIRKVKEPLFQFPGTGEAITPTPSKKFSNRGPMR
jgi:hypothetical protein